MIKFDEENNIDNKENNKNNEGEHNEKIDGKIENKT
jgi:hypothetical protein